MSSDVVQHPELDVVFGHRSERIDAMSLLNHPQLLHVTMRFVPHPYVLNFRLTSVMALEVTDQYICDEVVEYLLQGNTYAQPLAVRHLAVMFRKCDFFNREEWQSRIDTIIAPGNAPKAGARAKADVWANLGNTLWRRDGDRANRNGHDTCTVHPSYTLYGEEWDQLRCYLKAIDCDPTLPRAWHNAGWCLPDRDTKLELLNGDAMTALDCVVKSLEVDPTFFRGWQTLAYKMDMFGTVTVGGKMYTRQELYLKSLECKMDYALGWFNVSVVSIANDDQYVVVDGKKYTRRDCLLRSLELDQFYCRSWRMMGTVLRRSKEENERVRVHGSLFSGKQCLAMALICAELVNEPHNWLAELKKEVAGVCKDGEVLKLFSQWYRYSVTADKFEVITPDDAREASEEREVSM